LKGELYMARRTIVELMREEIARRLSDYYDCRSERDFYDWRQSALAFIIEKAVPIPEASYWQPRGWCPLCHGGSSGPYESLFTLPEGLRRHLDGLGNVRPCPVTQAALDLAREGLADRFAAAEAASRQKERERRERELLVLTQPNGAPKPRDENFPGWETTGRNEGKFRHRLGLAIAELKS